MGGGGAGRIPASRSRSWPGRRWGATTCSPRARGRSGFERDGSGEGEQLRPAMVAAVGCGFGGGGAVPSNGWRRKLQGFLGSRLGRLGALEKDGEASSPAAGNGGRGGAAVMARGGHDTRLK
jgi:hypothetical protein